MADIATIWSPADGRGDWYLSPVTDDIIVDNFGAAINDETGAAVHDGVFARGGELLIGNDLGTAILISLMTDATAGDDDVIADGSGDPRGWWGDLGADRPLGSKIWLRLRFKQTATVLALVKDDVERALDWLLDDGVATRVDVATEWTRVGMLGVEVTIHRAPGDPRILQFEWAWKEL